MVASGRFLAFGHDFGVRASDPALVAYIEDILGSLAAPGPPARWYAVLENEGSAEQRFTVRCGGETELCTSSPLSAVSFLLWHVNRSAVASCTDQVLVHAAAAESAGRAVIIPAPMEAGKTTLVAGLVRSGLRYLTDEAVAVEPGSRRITGLAKPLTVNAGSWDVLRDMEPTVAPDARRYVDRQWHLDVRSFREDALALSAAPALVIVPRYAYGAQTELAPLSRSDALVALCENSFNLTGIAQVGLDALAGVVRQSSCHRLTIGNLRTACSLVFELLEAGPSARTTEETLDVVIGRAPPSRHPDGPRFPESGVPVPAPFVASVEIGGESVLVNPSTGAVHQLDPLGTLVWSCLDGTSTVGDLVGQLSAAFDADRDRVRHDVSEFLVGLARSGLLMLQPDLVEPATEAAVRASPSPGGRP